jgi:trigger factor
MQITETLNDGLKRTLTVVVGKSEITERFDKRLDEIKDQVHIKGFRKGKVPVAHIRKLYGKSLMSEVLEKTVNETSSQAIAERKERPALRPDIALVGGQESMEQVIDGKADLAYSMSFEVLPEIPLGDFSTLKLERLVADVDDASLQKALDDIANRSTSYEAEAGRIAGDGDRVTIDFAGKIDGEAFEGGTGEGMGVVLGQGNMIPGFEDGLKGTKAGDQKVITATFPDAYPVSTLAGKIANFEIKVTEVARAKKPDIDDAFAQQLGLESRDKLKEAVSEQIRTEYEQASRMKLKRELLDALEAMHSFALPPSLVDFEFNQIWAQLEKSLKEQGKTFADEGKTEDETRTEYRTIAERRVRLGLVVGEIGDKNKIQVTQDELRRALIEQARRFPGQEKMVYEYFEKTPGAVAELRAPIFEDKVVDFVLGQAQTTDRKVSRDELMQAVQATTEA